MLGTMVLGVLSSTFLLLYCLQYGWLFSLACVPSWPRSLSAQSCAGIGKSAGLSHIQCGVGATCDAAQSNGNSFLLPCVVSQQSQQGYSTVPTGHRWEIASWDLSSLCKGWGQRLGWGLIIGGQSYPSSWAGPLMGLPSPLPSAFPPALPNPPPTLVPLSWSYLAQDVEWVGQHVFMCQPPWLQWRHKCALWFICNAPGPASGIMLHDSILEWFSFYLKFWSMFPQAEDNLPLPFRGFSGLCFQPFALLSVCAALWWTHKIP